MNYAFLLEYYVSHTHVCVIKLYCYMKVINNKMYKKLRKITKTTTEIKTLLFLYYNTIIN